MNVESLHIGELAKRTGITVRTLHHYDAIGLLAPSDRSRAGYRVYSSADVSRLQRVLSLRQLGFSLEEIRGCLDQPKYSPLKVVQLHLARVREQIELQRKLCSRLEAVIGRFESAEVVSVDEFLQTIEAIAMTEKYFTPEQLTLIEGRRLEAGEELLRTRQEDWAELIAEVRAEMDAGTDPAQPKPQALAKRWQNMVRETTAGDPEIEKALKRLWDEQGDALATQFGTRYDPRPVFGYIKSAIDATRA